MSMMSMTLLAAFLQGAVPTTGYAAQPPGPAGSIDNPPPFNCTVFDCTCQGFANYYGTHAGHGFGCAGPDARAWWSGRNCQADADCSCCQGPACKLPGAAPCICPHGPPGPPPPPPPPIFCDSPLEADYVCETCQKPRFSWETLPVFLHLSVQNTTGFSSDALKVIGKFPIVTIEKWQGCLAPDYTTEEDAMLTAAKQIKSTAQSLGKNITVIVWYDSYRIYTNTTVNPHARNTSGIACMNSAHAHILESNPGDLLHNSDGSLVLEGFASLHVVDYQHRAMQVFKRDMCLNMTKTGLVDGCGMDGSMSRAGSGALSGVAPANASAWNVGKICMMNGTTHAIGNGLAIGKLEWELGGEGGYANGIIQEGCTNSNGTVTNLRNVAQRSVALGGVPLVYECHANCEPTDPQCESSIAAFLAGAGPNAYWGFGSWVLQGGSINDRWSDIFEKPLGSPLSDATYDTSTQTWYRRFSSGTEVVFHAGNNTGTVEWAHGEP